MVSHRDWKSGRYAVVLLGASAIAASGLIAAAAPSFAAKVPVPSPARSYLPALRPPALRIGPHRLTLAAHKSQELFGVFCNSTTDCWAVGETKNKADTADQVLHWTGKKWFTVAVPNPAGTGKGAVNELFAVRCTSRANCWAVGDSQKPNHAVIDQMLHLRGTKWSVVSAPAPGGTAAEDINDLVDVACTSASSCWAVGVYGIQGMSVNPQVLFNQTLHWDGKKWTFVKPPNPGGNAMGDANFLNSVRCTAPDDCWAAWHRRLLTVGALKLRNVMLHWNGKKWAKEIVPSPVVKGKSFIDELQHPGLHRDGQLLGGRHRLQVHHQWLRAQRGAALDRQELDARQDPGPGRSGQPAVRRHLHGRRQLLGGRHRRRPAWPEPDAPLEQQDLVGRSLAQRRRHRQGGHQRAQLGPVHLGLGLLGGR